MLAVVKRVKERFHHLKDTFKGGPPASRQIQLDQLTFKFPPEDVRLKEQDVQVLTSRRPVKSKMVLTKEVVAFAIMETSLGKPIHNHEPQSRPCWDWIALADIEDVSQSMDQESQVSVEIKRADFIVHTSLEGRCLGKKYLIRAPTEKSCKDWMSCIIQEADEAKSELYVSPMTKFKNRCAAWYNQKSTQNVVAFVIFLSFGLSIADNQLRPEEGTSTSRMLNGLNIAFTVIFTLEVLFNLFGSWWRPFVSSVWNLLDLFIVVASLVVLAASLPQSINRVILAFRVLRLFGRFRHLREIVHAIAGALVPVLNAFLVGLIVAAIYVIIGVDLFHDRAETDFGTFGRGAYTLFMLAAADEWTVDDLPPFKGEQAMDMGVCLFVTTYILVINWTLLQVQMAVLLDHFIEGYDDGKEEYAGKMATRHGATGRKLAVDPLLQTLCSGFDTSEQLRRNIGSVFDAVDIERVTELGFEELRLGLMKLDCDPVIDLQREEFMGITRSLALCNERGRVGKGEFLAIMREQLHGYAQRQVIDAQAVAEEGAKERQLVAMCTSMKVVLSAAEELERQQQARLRVGREPILLSGSQRNLLHGGGSQRNLLHGGGSQRNLLHGGGSQRNLLHGGGSQRNLLHGGGSQRNLLHSGGYGTVLAEQGTFLDGTSRRHEAQERLEAVVRARDEVRAGLEELLRREGLETNRKTRERERREEATSVAAEREGGSMPGREESFRWQRSRREQGSFRSGERRARSGGGRVQDAGERRGGSFRKTAAGEEDRRRRERGREDGEGGGGVARVVGEALRAGSGRWVPGEGESWQGDRERRAWEAADAGEGDEGARQRGWWRRAGGGSGGSGIGRVGSSGAGIRWEEAASRGAPGGETGGRGGARPGEGRRGGERVDSLGGNLVLIRRSVSFPPEEGGPRRLPSVQERGGRLMQSESWSSTEDSEVA